MAEEKLPCLQLVDAEGAFNEAGLDSFVKHVKLAECGLSYAIVSIMGPQSSGKSTLLNHLFGTKFVEMDAFKGRSQTTKGVWLARAKNIQPQTIVMDLEGTDGRERGEDKTAFEKQSALFALAVSDIVLINMWCHDIGREQASNKPLLKTVFQVMMRLFTPRKSTLLFAIRDKTKTPLEVLEGILRNDVQKIWDSVPKPEKHKNTSLQEFFNVEVIALSSYEEKEELFMEQISDLQQRFMNSIMPGGLAGDRRAVVPGSGFPFSTREIWKVIKENKDLDLPAHTVMVATVRCEEIANEKLSELAASQDWKTLEDDASVGAVAGFGKKLNNVLVQYLSRYDTEAVFFDERVRNSKRQILLNKASELTYPAYQAMLGHHRAKAFDNFKKDVGASPSDNEGFAAKVQRCTKACMSEFDKGCADSFVESAGWDPSKIRDKLQRDIDAQATALQAEKLAEVAKKYEEKLDQALSEPVVALLDAATPDTWTTIQKRLDQETRTATNELSENLVGFELDSKEEIRMTENLQEAGRRIVEENARKEANQALIRMKDRFTTTFSHGPGSMPRVWSGKEDIKTIIRDARMSAIKLLSTLAALRLDMKKADHIETALTSLVHDGSESGAKGGMITDRESTATTGSNVLASSTWEGVAANDTLIAPVQCRRLWRQLNKEVEYTITQALTAQEASRRGASSLPPPWAMVAMACLGFNEFMMLLRNPLYLLVAFVVFLLGRVVWTQLDIEREFQHSYVTGAVSVSAKVVPTFLNFLKRLVEEGQQMADNSGFTDSSTASSADNTGAPHRHGPMQGRGTYADLDEDMMGNGDE